MLKLSITSLGIVGMFIFSGCVGKSDMQVVSAGNIGCSPNNIQISNDRVGMSTSSWTAKCNGKTFQCGGDDMLRGIHCSEVK